MVEQKLKGGDNLETMIQSTNPEFKIRVRSWQPQGQVRGVIQLLHGMTEHIDRYHEFASFLVAQGFFVIGHDHVGHGKSVQGRQSFGYFGSLPKSRPLIGDVAKVQCLAKKKYPQVPYFILGHSMGSLILRNYLISYPEVPLTGTIMMGTTAESALKMQAAILLSHGMMKLQGPKRPATLVNRLAFEGFNRRFEPGITKSDWLSSDELQVKRYLADPWTQFIFTNSGYHELFLLTKRASSSQALRQITPQLPMLLIAGENDPVGQFGKKVTILAKKLQKLGQNKVELALISKARHELLQEKQREQVFQQIVVWIEKQVAE